MTGGRCPRVTVGPGLSFRFELPVNLLGRIERFLGHFTGNGDARSATAPIPVTSESLPEAAAAPRTLLEEPPLLVRRAGELVLFELPRIRAWCDGALGRAGICMEQPSDTELDQFTALALAPMLIELAASRSWLGVHAAGVAIGDFGILLPGPSGAGKSTIFGQMHRAGHGVLSDDLMWLRPAPGGPRMVAFPRGGRAEQVPAPTADEVVLRAIVCPTVSSGAKTRLRPLAFPAALQSLIRQGGFLTSGAQARDRFGAFVHLARSVPAYRLEVGWRRPDAPAVLARLAAAASHTSPRDASSNLRSASTARPTADPRQRSDHR